MEKLTPLCSSFCSCCACWIEDTLEKLTELFWRAICELEIHWFISVHLFSSPRSPWLNVSSCVRAWLAFSGKKHAILWYFIRIVLWYGCLFFERCNSTTHVWGNLRELFVEQPRHPSWTFYSLELAQQDSKRRLVLHWASDWRQSTPRLRSFLQYPLPNPDEVFLLPSRDRHSAMPRSNTDQERLVCLVWICLTLVQSHWNEEPFVTDFRYRARRWGDFWTVFCRQTHRAGSILAFLWWLENYRSARPTIDPSDVHSRKKKFVQDNRNSNLNQINLSSILKVFSSSSKNNLDIWNVIVLNFFI